MMLLKKTCVASGAENHRQWVLQTVQRIFFRGKRAQSRHISKKQKKTKESGTSPYLEHW